MTPLEMLLEILSGTPGIPLQSLPSRGEEGGWMVGVLVLVGALVLALLQALGKRG